MPAIFIGRANSGKAILIERKILGDSAVCEHFSAFTERDAFDALMAVEYLLLCERRRPHRDRGWTDSLETARVLFLNRQTADSIQNFRILLGITSSFGARDYGKSLVRPHFRTL